MNPETPQPVSVPSDSSGTDPRGATVPIWLIVLPVLLLYWGAIYFDHNGGWFHPKVFKPYTSFEQVLEYVPIPEGPNLRRGEQWYNAACSLCHGTDGAGKPGQAPPLAGSEWVTAEGANRLIRIPVLGLNGPISVGGKEYIFGAGMTAVTPISTRATTFPDDVLADILSYIRQAWGNKAPPVTVAEVTAVRDEIGNRSKQLTVSELLSLPEKK
jgi:mono/diheme cytochrome c family protein